MKQSIKYVQIKSIIISFTSKGLIKHNGSMCMYYDEPSFVLYNAKVFIRGGRLM